MNTDRFKFRVWNAIENKYESSDSFYFLIAQDGTIIDPSKDLYEWDNKCFIVEQCTGLKDANGKLIYEGDIVADKNNKFFIAYSDKEACFTVNLIGNSSEIKTCGCSDYWLKTKTIVGNIHENQELLEEQK